MAKTLSSYDLEGLFVREITVSLFLTIVFYVNSPTIGAEVHLPFGGTKATGNGHREAGIQALDVFSEWKSCYIDFSGTLQRAQIDG